MTETEHESGGEKPPRIRIKGCWAQGRHWEVVPFPLPAAVGVMGLPKRGLEVVIS